MTAVIALTEKHELIAKAIEQHGAGKSLREIANELKSQGIDISYNTIRRWMLGSVPDQYKKAQEQALINRIIDADEMLESAPDACNIARAREIAKFARWDAERRLPHLFGQKIENTGTVIQVNISNPTQRAQISDQSGAIIDIVPPPGE